MRSSLIYTTTMLAVVNKSFACTNLQHPQRPANFENDYVEASWNKTLKGMALRLVIKTHRGDAK